MNAITLAQPRAVVHRTRGNAHGPITRLLSPGRLGRKLKPFVFLDWFDLDLSGGHQGFGLHPHSGIATFTWLIEGEAAYEDTTGARGVLPAGGVEWMRAGKGVWHASEPTPASRRMAGFQLWLALPAELELAPAESVYLAPERIPQAGPAKVLLGEYGGGTSPVPSPAGVSYLAVSLKDGERWTFEPPAGHEVAWTALNAGALRVAGEAAPLTAGELAAFAESGEPIEFIADGDAAFVLGSSPRHPHELATGYYSVHTSPEALAAGEAEIARIGELLRELGRLQA
ncbi:pirin family protein [Chromobacterium violaceum]|uniref:pirin family protein n=1 Tax=Chromobacterium violaceum TaxID=536 RepID=UPI00143DB1E1|nr:pirin family protein [Chromobacterium violaceum]QIY80625.1 pirin family protein [Chromobacterium violaceum]